MTAKPGVVGCGPGRAGNRLGRGGGTLESVSNPHQAAAESAPVALLDEWADRVMAYAEATLVDAHPPRWVAGIEGAVGALGYGDTEQESLEDLRSGLPGWAAMKLDLGATDIPSAGGLSLANAG